MIHALLHMCNIALLSYFLLLLALSHSTCIFLLGYGASARYTTQVYTSSIASLSYYTGLKVDRFSKPEKMDKKNQVEHCAPCIAHVYEARSFLVPFYMPVYGGGAEAKNRGEGGEVPA